MDVCVIQDLKIALSDEPIVVGQTAGFLVARVSEVSETKVRFGLADSETVTVVHYSGELPSGRVLCRTHGALVGDEGQGTMSGDGTAPGGHGLDSD